MINQGYRTGWATSPSARLSRARMYRTGTGAAPYEQERSYAAVEVGPVSVIRYGDLNVEMADGHGALVTRLAQRQSPVDSFFPRGPEAVPSPPIWGREQEVADALRAIEQGRPVEFHARCGNGITTLLQHITASAAERHRASSCVYLRADRGSVEDLLQQLVTDL